jgi:acyl carrier protein
MGLDVVEMVMAVEAEFDLDIPDADAGRLATVGDLYWYVREHAAVTEDLWGRLLDVIERETAVKRERLHPEARFTRDLGLD